MMKELKEWKLACPPNDLDLVFPNKAGQPINQTNMVNRHFEPALKKAGLPKIRFHDLRHYADSRIMPSCVPIFDRDLDLSWLTPQTDA
jgi:integrase